jgi:F-type H+-transporting ATPase subunit delta
VTRDAIARRYGAALFDVVRQKRSADPAGRDLASLSALIAGHVDLQRALEAHGVAPARKTAAMDAVMTAAGVTSDEVRRLVGLLGERDRISMLPDVAAAYRRLEMTAKRIVEAEVVTTVPLPPPNQQALARALGRALGAEVTITATQDPAILGGVRATVGSVVFDGTVAGQLERLRHRLATAT